MKYGAFLSSIHGLKQESAKLFQFLGRILSAKRGGSAIKKPRIARGFMRKIEKLDRTSSTSAMGGINIVTLWVTGDFRISGFLLDKMHDIPSFLSEKVMISGKIFPWQD